jgi:uncharacterized SAM-binding protein YcdF (DUF218 family)
MNLWHAFAPHALYPLGLVAYYLALTCLARQSLTGHSLPLAATVFGLWLVYSALFVLFVAFLPPRRWLRAKATNKWRKQAKEADVAIVLGFGYEQDEHRNMKPGEANEALLAWTLEHTRAETILVQEGVWVAACDSKADECGVSGRQLRRIHEHRPDVYLNTLDTAYCALQAMEDLGARKAVLVAHPLQLQRALWDFQAVQRANLAWQTLEFVVPEMPDVPYVPHSVHVHTRCEPIWRLVELLVARPRDYLSPIPRECKAPLRSGRGDSDA